MKRTWLPLVLALVLATGASAAVASAEHDPSSVSFTNLGLGSVSGKFHPRHPGNRVFYASSAAEGRRWLPYIVNVRTLDFRRYGYFAIFYAESPRGFPSVSSMSLEPGGTLVAHVELHAPCLVTVLPDGTILAPSCPPPAQLGPGPRMCSSPGGDCPPPWGSFLLVQIDKSSLTVRPTHLVVTTTPCPEPQLQPDGSYLVEYC